VEGLSSLVFLALLMGIFYFMLIRPQKRRVQQHRALVDSLGEGDEVVTIGGLFGVVVRLGDDDIDLEVAPGTTLRVLKSAVARRVTESVGDGEGEGA
jgi:preprotein translocase subunit YajC